MNNIRTSILKRNFIANFGGLFFNSLISLILVPIYLHYLGVEAYGLIGFLTSLQIILNILDFGLGATTNREVAQRLNFPNLWNEIRTLIRTLEVVYLAMGALVATTIIFLSGVIATRWLNLNNFSEETTRLAIVIFGLIVALRWPVSLYSGALKGLERQPTINAISVIATLFRTSSTLIAIVAFHKKLEAFLLCQMGSALLELILLAIFTWRYLPNRGEFKPYFNLKSLKFVWRFAFQVTLISISIVIIKQLDKVLISKLLPIDQLGYYMTATQASGALYLFIGPLFNAIYPRFSSLISKNDFDRLGQIYHRSSQIISFVIAPLAAILIFFSHDVLLIWTRSGTVANLADWPLSLLAFGTMLSASMNTSYALQLSSGLNWIPLYMSWTSLIALVPIIYFSILHFGLTGGAFGWALWNLFYFLTMPILTHRYILRGHLRRWYFQDTLPFILSGLTIFGLLFSLHYFYPGLENNPRNVIFLICLGILIYIIFVFIYHAPLRSYFGNLVSYFFQLGKGRFAEKGYEKLNS